MGGSRQVFHCVCGLRSASPLGSGLIGRPLTGASLTALRVCLSKLQHITGAASPRKNLLGCESAVFLSEQSCPINRAADFIELFQLRNEEQAPGSTHGCGV